MAVVDPKELVKDVDALMADVDMAGSCCNVPDVKMLAYTLALKETAGHCKGSQGGTHFVWYLGL
jgi:hypothetical protein